MKRLQILWAVGMVLILGSVAWGQDINEYALIQGFISLDGISPIPDGNYPMESRLHSEPTGGVPLYEETHGSVAVSGGLFTINLGSVTPIPDSLFKIVPLWLEMVVNSEVITPRIRLASVPRAFHVRTIDGAKGGTITGDLNVAGTMVAHPPNPITPGLVIQGAPGFTADFLDVKKEGDFSVYFSVGEGALYDTYGGGFRFGLDGSLLSRHLSLLPPPDDGSPTMVIQGGLRQTGNLMEIQNSAGTPLLKVDPAGVVHSCWIRLQAAPGQTENLLEVKDELGMLQLNVDPAGGLHVLKSSSFLGTTRFLAQLATNIVEYVDEDDITVGFVAADGGIHTTGASSFGDKVSIGGAAPANSKLQINGALATAVTNTTSNLTLTGEHSVILCSLVSSSITIDLPSAVGIAGRQYTIKHLPPTLPLNGVTIDPFGSETIDGAAIYVLSSANRYVSIVSDGANWWIIANN